MLPGRAFCICALLTFQNARIITGGDVVGAPGPQKRLLVADAGLTGIQAKPNSMCFSAAMHLTLCSENRPRIPLAAEEVCPVFPNIAEHPYPPR